MNILQAMMEAWAEITQPPKFQLKLHKSNVEEGPKDRRISLKLPTENPVVFDTFHQKYPDLVNSFIIKRIRRAINSGADKAYLFDLGDSGKDVSIESKNFVTVLQRMREHSIETEQYEQIVVLDKLLDQISVNRVINETKGM